MGWKILRFEDIALFSKYCAAHDVIDCQDFKVPRFHGSIDTSRRIICLSVGSRLTVLRASAGQGTKVPTFFGGLVVRVRRDKSPSLRATGLLGCRQKRACWMLPRRAPYLQPHFNISTYPHPGCFAARELGRAAVGGDAGGFSRLRWAVRGAL